MYQLVLQVLKQMQSYCHYWFKKSHHFFEIARVFFIMIVTENVVLVRKLAASVAYTAKEQQMMTITFPQRRQWIISNDGPNIQALYKTFPIFATNQLEVLTRFSMDAFLPYFEQLFCGQLATTNC